MVFPHPLRETVGLGADVCASVARMLDTTWPDQLAAEMRILLRDPFTQP